MSDKGRALVMPEESMDWVNMDSWPLDTSSPLRSRTDALYMMFNLALDEHFYTMSVPERDNPLRNLGYTYKRIAGWLYPNTACGPSSLSSQQR